MALAYQAEQFTKDRHSGPPGPNNYSGSSGYGQSHPASGAMGTVEPRPGEMSMVLKIRLGYMIVHLLLAVATCLVVSIITQYTPLIVISTAGAASAASYVLLNVWQTVRGGKHRFVDRADWEMWYLVSHAFIWAVCGGITIFLNQSTGSRSGCAYRLAQRKSSLPFTGPTLCNGMLATIGLSFANVGLIVGWAVWFAMTMRKVQPDDKGRTWKASVSKLFRPWHY